MKHHLINRIAYRHFILFIIITFLGKPPMLFAQQRLDTSNNTAVGTSKIWGVINGIAIEGMVQSPAKEITPLQIVCVFEYTDGDIFNSPPALPAAINGMVHLDKDLGGIITELRKSGKFVGHALETILLTPPHGTIKAQKLLLIGLGDRNHFTPELILSVASVGMQEALRLHVSSYAFASDLKDAGIDSPTAAVAGYGVTGAIKAYRTALFLQQHKMATFKTIKKITLLAGPSFFKVAGSGIETAIEGLKKESN